MEETEERWWEPDLRRLKGDLLLSLSAQNASGAEAEYGAALATARRQGARMLELRAATGLARLRRDRGARAAARDLLAPVYGWFAEGLDTADLREASTLLRELSDPLLARPSQETDRSSARSFAPLTEWGPALKSGSFSATYLPAALAICGASRRTY